MLLRGIETSKGERISKCVVRDFRAVSFQVYTNIECLRVSLFNLSVLAIINFQKEKEAALLGQPLYKI